MFYLFLRERDRAQAGKGQRQEETQNPKQAPGSRAVRAEPDAGFEPTNRRLVT